MGVRVRWSLGYSSIEISSYVYSHFYRLIPSPSQSYVTVDCALSIWVGISRGHRSLWITNGQDPHCPPLRLRACFTKAFTAKATWTLP